MGSTSPLTNPQDGVINVMTQRVQTVCLPTARIERVLFDRTKNAVLYGRPHMDIRTGKVRKTLATVNVSVDFKGMKRNGFKIDFEDRLRPFDREIYDAVVNLCVVNKNWYFTPKMILRVLTGDVDDIKVTEGMRASILTSIDKMRETDIEIYASDEAQKFGIQDFQYRGSLLPSAQVTGVSLNNNTVADCVQFTSMPPLYDYAKLRNQITSVDVKLLAVPKLRYTLENFELKGYLLREIRWMNHSGSKRQPVLLYNTIFRYLEGDLQLNEAHRHRCARVRDRVKRCLDFWEQKEFIKSYQEVTEKRIVTKVCIKV